jgi:acyl transferase domain-containing protein
MKRAVVICPGRGTYNKAELGYLGRHFPDPALLARFDRLRERAGQKPVSALDSAARFLAAEFTRGDNASALIFAASLGDFLSIDGDAVQVVAVTGNSMGWYSALACAGAVAPEVGFEIANTMGTLMHEASIGGQLVYPFLGDDWRPDPDRKAELLALVDEIGARPGHALTLSIDLGGMLVLAGDAAGLKAFEAAVPRVNDRFPMRLAGHAAFHTALQRPMAEKGRAALPPDLFGQPRLPMIDGRGAVWWPGATDTGALWDYTLGHQVTEAYDLTRAVTVAAREFAPALFIVTGPGTTLGGAVAQSLVLAGWRGMGSKQDFQKQQNSTPLLAGMGHADQRPWVTKGG